MWGFFLVCIHHPKVILFRHISLIHDYGPPIPLYTHHFPLESTLDPSWSILDPSCSSSVYSGPGRTNSQLLIRSYTPRASSYITPDRLPSPPAPTMNTLYTSLGSSKPMLEPSCTTQNLSCNTLDPTCTTRNVSFNSLNPSRPTLESRLILIHPKSIQFILHH